MRYTGQAARLVGFASAQNQERRASCMRRGHGVRAVAALRCDISRFCLGRGGNRSNRVRHRRGVRSAVARDYEKRPTFQSLESLSCDDCPRRLVSTLPRATIPFFLWEEFAKTTVPTWRGPPPLRDL